MKAAWIANVAMVASAAACGSSGRIEGGPERRLPAPDGSAEIAAGADAGSVAPARVAAHARPLPPEAFMRGYLMWFGGLAPYDVQLRARKRDVLGQWRDEMGALGFPDYAFDFPRAGQSNAAMTAEVGRLGEALCVLAAEHDLHGGATPLRERVVFAFAPSAAPTREAFAAGFDVLHRTFLGYPSALATAERLDRFYALYKAVAEKHGAGHDLTADETGWVAVCAALVAHPEARIY